MSKLTNNLELTKPEITESLGSSLNSFNDNFDKIDSVVSNLKTDYIVEQGTSGSWGYRKWNSGIAECWLDEYEACFSINISVGNLFRGAVPSPGAYPGQISFTKKPYVSISWVSTDYFMCPIFANVSDKTICPDFILMDPNTGDNKNGVFSIYVRGSWK